MAATEAVTIRRADVSDSQLLSDFAALTFPLACPPHTTADDIQRHIATRLSRAAFEADLADAATVCDLAQYGGQVVGYTMLVGDVAPPDGDGGASPMELRRIYVHPDWHGRGVADALVAESLRHALVQGHDVVWLGTNEMNDRAVAFYRKHGFEVVGSKTFRVGTAVEHDHVMARAVAVRTAS